ncbi:MAG: zinc ABC transporter substrate-binding protein [Nocardioidaceae bacterium]|nr:zinc ABC transporter substrate-binding protein [Nocardioidaceae bacterium]
MKRLLLVALLLPLAACGGTGDDGRPTVVASFYPLEFLVRELAGEQVRVVDLTAPGVEPHDLELKIKQTAEIADADLVVYTKDLQPAVDETVAQNARRSFDVGDAVHLEGDNPHFWLDPARMELAAAALEKQLARLLPEETATLKANLATLSLKLQQLDAAYASGLRGCPRHLVVTSHDAFGYQTKYGLEFAGIAGLTPDSEPSPAHLAKLRELIAREHITTVFGETIASKKMATTLASDLGLRTAVLDPIEGVEKGSGEDYLSLMRANLAALEKANGCAKVAP